MKKTGTAGSGRDMERLQMALGQGGRGLSGGYHVWYALLCGQFTPEELKPPWNCATARGAGPCDLQHHARNDEVARLPRWLEYLDSVGVDAVILADVVPWLWPSRPPTSVPHFYPGQHRQLPVCHRAWHDLGASRVILAGS